MTDLPPHILAAVEQADAGRAAAEDLLDAIITGARQIVADNPGQREPLIIAPLVMRLRETMSPEELAVGLGLAVMRLIAQPRDGY